MRTPAVTLAIVLLWMCPGTGFAEEKSAWKGPGTISCTDYAQAVRSTGGTMRNYYFGWAQGFMSGLNTPLLMAGMKTTNLEGRSVNDQMRVVDYYCDQRPLATYVQAILSLYDTMRSEHGLHDWRPNKDY